jgi:N-acetylmuramoyl-L-alanine amidase
MSLYIWLDAGHGGKDPGAMGHGLHEADVVLKLCKYLNDELSNYYGVKVSLTRWDDHFVSLEGRCEMANKAGADVFISMHNNAAGDSSAHGYESYALEGASSSTERWRGIVHNTVMDFLKGYGISDRGKKHARYYVLRGTRMTAVLFENLFITNKKEAGLLGDSTFLKKLAKAYAEGLAKAFDLKRKAAPKPEPKPEPKPSEPNGTYYRVVTGSFEDKANAEERVAKLKKAGFESFIDVVKY